MSDLNKIIFGGAALSSTGGGYGMGEIENSQALIKGALDYGITSFDTAPIYGFNESEKALGLYLAPVREKVKIISKAGVSWHSTKRVNMSNDPKIVQNMLHASLKNLKSDYIDIYMTHWPDPKVDIRFTLEVLKKAQNEGKILEIGMCNTNLDELLLAGEVCKIKYIQSECNLFQDKLTDLQTYANENSIKTMGWGTFDKGILAGSVTTDRKFDQFDCRSWAPWWKKSNWKDKVNKVESMKSMGLNVFDLALHYSLKNTDYSLCGFKSIEQLKKIMSVMNNEVDPDDILKAVKIARS